MQMQGNGGASGSIAGAIFLLICIGIFGYYVLQGYNMPKGNIDMNISESKSGTFEELEYLQDEKRVFRLLNLILTNKRLYNKYNGLSGNSGVTQSSVIFLEDLSSIVIYTVNRIYLLLGAIMLILFDFYLVYEKYNSLKKQGELRDSFFDVVSQIIGSEFFVILFIAIGLFVAYQITKRSYIQFMSKGGVPIEFNIKGINPELISQIIYKVSKTKDERIAYLSDLNSKVES